MGLGKRSAKVVGDLFGIDVRSFEVYVFTSRLPFTFYLPHKIPQLIPIKSPQGRPT